MFYGFMIHMDHGSIGLTYPRTHIPACEEKFLLLTGNFCATTLPSSTCLLVTLCWPRTGLLKLNHGGDASFAFYKCKRRPTPLKVKHENSLHGSIAPLSLPLSVQNDLDFKFPEREVFVENGKKI